MKKKSEWRVYESFSNIRSEDKLWNNGNLNKLRNILYNKFTEVEDWEKYKIENEIKDAVAKEIKINWNNAFYYDKINKQNSIHGYTTIHVEYYDEKNKIIVIKDPFSGISWDYGEPTNESANWIGVPEKLAENLLMLSSFKN